MEIWPLMLVGVLNRSLGRALEWHSRGQRFDPAYLHQIMDIGNYIVNQIIQFNSNFLIELAVNQYLKTKG